MKRLALVMVAAFACGKSDKAPPPTVAGSASGSKALAFADATTTDARPTCVPKGELVVSATELIRVCSETSKTCISIDPTTGVADSIGYSTPKPSATSAAKIEKRADRLVACLRDQCRDIGANARKAIEKTTDIQLEHLSATADLAALAIPGEPGTSSETWDIAKDQPLKLDPAGPQGLASAVAVGNELVTIWSNFTGPPHHLVYTSAGRQIEFLGAGDAQVATIDDTRWAALSADHTLHLFGSTRHKIEIIRSIGDLAWEAGEGGLAVLPDKNLAVVLVRATEATAVIVDTERGAVFTRWPLTICP